MAETQRLSSRPDENDYQCKQHHLVYLFFFLFGIATRLRSRERRIGFFYDCILVYFYIVIL
jgi:hypothetical protein